MRQRAGELQYTKRDELKANKKVVPYSTKGLSYLGVRERKLLSGSTIDNGGFDVSGG
jgi:hypothetical protein